MFVFKGCLVSPIFLLNQTSLSLYVVVLGFSSFFDNVSFTISFCQSNSICFGFELRFKKQTAQLSFCSGLNQVNKLSVLLYLNASTPSGSWLIAITSLLVRMVR